ncbi:MAG TPA: response regulator [Phototrophicaceae bacterium]|nr:response regulator [Phototrophicaceae bacterium]
MIEQLPRDLLQDWKVLVVDDDPDSLDVAARLLRFYSADVTTATNGKEGLAAVRASRPRFIISDLSMPEMDGWEMLFELKNNRATQEIPVIALTAHAMFGDRDRAISAGFHNYLTKPLTPATFMKDLVILLLDIPELAAYIMIR